MTSLPLSLELPLMALLFALLWRERGTGRAGRGAYVWRIRGIPLPLGGRVIAALPVAAAVAAGLDQPVDLRWTASAAASLLLGLLAVATGHASHQDAGYVRVGDPYAPRDGQTTEALTGWLDLLFGSETRATPGWKRTARDCIGNGWIGFVRHLAFVLPWAWTGHPGLVAFAAAGLLHFAPYLLAKLLISGRTGGDPVPAAERGVGAVIGVALVALART